MSPGCLLDPPLLSIKAKLLKAHKLAHSKPAFPSNQSEDCLYLNVYVPASGPFRLLNHLFNSLSLSKNPSSSSTCRRGEDVSDARGALHPRRLLLLGLRQPVRRLRPRRIRGCCCCHHQLSPRSLRLAPHPSLFLIFFHLILLSISLHSTCISNRIHKC